MWAGLTKGVLAMQFQVLGSLEMNDGGKSYIPTAPKQRQLLALLLLNSNRVVPIQTCVNELWGEDPPDAARATLQSHILQLRHALKSVPGVGSLPAARNILETRDGGYLFVTRPGDLDTEKFTGLLRTGKELLKTDDRKASDLLAEALNLWRGPALADVRHGPVLRRHVVHLEEERVTAQEHRIDADLRLGRHRELIGELSALAVEHPTREHLHAKLTLALYRSGRRVQALDVLQQLHRALRRDLGLETSPWVHNLHQAVLASSASIDMP